MNGSGRRYPASMAAAWGVVVFGIAFGLLEAIVVTYIQRIVAVQGTPAIRAESLKPLLNLSVIAFLNPPSTSALLGTLTRIETWREASTIVILACVGFLTGRTIRDGTGIFLIAFGVWDIAYYVWLRVLTGWPTGLLSPDVFFLIPVAWVGPVVTPMLASIVLIVIGTKIYFRR
jgi:hypothetical protein